MTAGRRRSRTAPERPRIVLLDPASWDSLASFGAAVRRRGMRVTRVSTRRGPVASVVLGVLDGLVFGRDRQNLRSAPGALELVGVMPLLDPPTVDVQGPEELVSEIHDARPGTSFLERAEPDQDLPVRLLYDKLAMTRYAAGLGIPVPATVTTPAAPRFPLVVKRSVGSGGQSVRVVADQQQFERARTELEVGLDNPLFYQEFKRGRVINYGGVAHRGRLLTGSAYEALTSPADPLGPAVAVTVIDGEELEGDVTRLLAALGYSGFFCIDYISPDDGPPLLIDFNPRVFGSWLALEHAGLPLLDSYLSLHGLADEPPAPSVAVGHTTHVTLRPPAGVRGYRELAAEARHLWGTLLATRRVTGDRFVLAFALRSLWPLTSVALGLLADRRDRGTGPAA